MAFNLVPCPQHPLKATRRPLEALKLQGVTYSNEDDRTRDILSSLGFDSGLIGATFDVRPLEASE